MKSHVQVNLRRLNRPTLRLPIAAMGLLIAVINANGQDLWPWRMLKCSLPAISRRQVNNRLGKLSRNLADLAGDKQELAETLSGGDNEQIRPSLTGLERTVTRLRQSLDDITSVLHASDRQRGGQVTDQIFRALTDKNLIIEEARRKLNGGEPNMDAVRTELEYGVRSVLLIKSQVDALITELQNKPCPP